MEESNSTPRKEAIVKLEDPDIKENVAIIGQSSTEIAKQAKMSELSDLSESMDIEQAQKIVEELAFENNHSKVNNNQAEIAFSNDKIIAVAEL